MKRLPKGIWTDTSTGKRCRVLYYDSRSRCYRVWVEGLGRWWVAVETWNSGRYLKPSAWDTIARGDGVDVG